MDTAKSPEQVPFEESALEKETIVAQERESWETVRRALPEVPQAGPRLRALFAIDCLIDAVQDVVGRSPGDPEFHDAVDVIDRALGAILRRDPETHATMGLIARIHARALEIAGHQPEDLPADVLERLWPEHRGNRATCERAAKAWAAASNGKRVDVWGPIADAVAAAGLAPRAPLSLKRQWLAWQRENRDLTGET